MNNFEGSHEPDVRSEKLTILQAWLEDGAQFENPLIRWMQCYDMPIYKKEDTNPHLELLRSIPNDENRNHSIATLARSVALLLEEMHIVVQELSPLRRAQLQYNTLQLCTNLESPSQLCAPLLAIFQDCVQKGDAARINLKEKYLGIELSSVLRGALIYNQGDRSLKNEWYTILQEGTHPVLGGNVYCALEGLSHMGVDDQKRVPWPVQFYQEYIVSEQMEMNQQAFSVLVDCIKECTSKD